MDDAAGHGPINSSPLPGAGDEPSLSSIRRILFATESERIDQLEAEKSRLSEEISALQARLVALQADLTATEARLNEQTANLAGDIDEVIARKAKDAPEDLAEALGSVMAGAIRVQDRRARDELVDAVSPVLSEAIEVQIRDSRHSLVEALFPIIGEMAQRYIGEYFRELQRNIDARLKASFTPAQIARRLNAQLHGVPAADLELRDALPFSVREIFLIQNGSGILMAHAGSDSAIDSDLISGMLTAVRSFMRDSFSRQDSADPMDEIQYGDQRIIIQDGRLCYLAVVIWGIEPSGFRAELRRYLNYLHNAHHTSLQEFDGNMETLDEVAQSITRLNTDLAALVPTTTSPKPFTRGQKMTLALGGLGGLFLLGIACFYLQFTVALLPLAFGQPTATPTNMPSSTPTTTATDYPTSTLTPTSAPTATSTMTPTVIPTMTPTVEPTATVMPTENPSPTAIPFSVLTNHTVWAFTEPSLDSARLGPIELGAAVTIIGYEDPWLQVEWQSATGPQQGWLTVRWVDLVGTPPPDFPGTP
ncbi:MAG: hypothetical protein DCC51_06100 [Anaerolineae bacterium]|nr:MAG: hypothetical protein DCC51_06100 [Anaerolineae bacterium]